MSSALIVLGGDVAVQDVTATVDTLVIAADSGLNALAANGIRPHVVVGDMDSVDTALLDRLDSSVEVVTFDTEKDFTDFELALREAITRGAKDVTVAGMFGGRVDHALANVSTLADPQFRDMKRTAIGGTTRIDVVDSGSLNCSGHVGELISLLPHGGDATGVTTTGLKWNLDNATMHPFGSLGISNLFTARHVTVSLTSGVLLIVRPEARLAKNL